MEIYFKSLRELKSFKGILDAIAVKKEISVKKVVDNVEIIRYTVYNQTLDLFLVEDFEESKITYKDMYHSLLRSLMDLLAEELYYEESI